jgi:hypothetical protein
VQGVMRPRFVDSCCWISVIFSELVITIASEEVRSDMIATLEREPE